MKRRIAALMWTGGEWTCAELASRMHTSQRYVRLCLSDLAADLEVERELRLEPVARKRGGMTRRTYVWRAVKSQSQAALDGMGPLAQVWR
jgi:predicted ArsR family transcriptional regulator